MTVYEADIYWECRCWKYLTASSKTADKDAFLDSNSFETSHVYARSKASTRPRTVSLEKSIDVRPPVVPKFDTETHVALKTTGFFEQERKNYARQGFPGFDMNTWKFEFPVPETLVDWWSLPARVSLEIELLVPAGRDSRDPLMEKSTDRPVWTVDVGQIMANAVISTITSSFIHQPSRYYHRVLLVVLGDLAARAKKTKPLLKLSTSFDCFYPVGGNDKEGNQQADLFMANFRMRVVATGALLSLVRVDGAESE